MQLQDLIRGLNPAVLGSMTVTVPTFAVIGTEVFAAFLDRNRLRGLLRSGESDEGIARAFQQADLPSEILGDLRALTGLVRTPLAIRSSSLLEDALLRPFAGVYETKMTPNNQPDPSGRFQKLVEAVKFVYASTFFQGARDYLRTLPQAPDQDEMAVIIQDVAGIRHGDRFYPHVSGVARTFNFYPMRDRSREDGIVDLALGLGKIIVDEGIGYSYVPTSPKTPPPFASARDFMQHSQTEFWAVNMGKPPAFNPVGETEYLVRAGIADADYDGVLPHLASTYDAGSDRLRPGSGRPGPKVLNFASLLGSEEPPFNDAVSAVMDACRHALGGDGELEFAVTLPGPREGTSPRLHLVQMRPMAAPNQVVDIEAEELEGEHVLLVSDWVMGNGLVDDIQDVVYVRPDTFDFAHTRAVAEDLTRINAELVGSGRPYLLIGFGRWGSADPWLGIPVQWGQISGARAIVEAGRKEREVEASQGTHFFHNLTSFEVSYFHVGADADPGVRWDRLETRKAAHETERVRHLRLDAPLSVKVDGRSGRGVVRFAPPQGGQA